MSSNCVCRNNLQNADLPSIWAVYNKKKLSQATVIVKILSFIWMIHVYVWGYVYIHFRYCIYNTNEHSSLTVGILHYLKSLTRTYTTKKASTTYFSWRERHLLQFLYSRQWLQLICYHYYSEVSISTALGVNNLHVCTILVWQNWNCNNK